MAGQMGGNRCRSEAAMKHPASRALFGYWERQRGERTAPERTDIEPGAIRQVLSDVFILSLNGEAGHPFRLAGTRVCAMFGRELKTEPFIALWAAESRQTVIDLMAILANEHVGTVASVNATNSSGETLDLELLLLPLSSSRRDLARTIGVLAPLQIPPWFGAEPVGALSLGASRRHIAAASETGLMPRFMTPPLRDRFTVHLGGRS
jgi:hypothetical protein